MLSAKIKSLYSNRSLRSMAIYTFTNFFGKAASFLLLFVFTNPLYITPSENGLLSLISNGVLFLIPFLSMGIIHSTSADYFKLTKAEFRNEFTSGFVLPFIVMILSMGLIYIFRAELHSTYGLPAMVAWLIPLICFLTFCNEQLLNIARNIDEPMVYLRANVSRIILELGLSFALVVFFAWRWEGRITGIFVAYIAIAFYGFYYFTRKNFLFGRVKPIYLKNQLIYAVPVILMQLSIFFMSSSDRFFLSKFKDDNNETVGIYSIAATFASILMVLSTALLQYFYPRIYSKLSGERVDYNDIRKTFFYYLAAMFTGMLLIMLLTPAAYYIFINEKYHAALNYVYLLFIGTFLWAITYFFYAFLLYNKEKKKLIIISVFSISCSILMNYWLVSTSGSFGAALANALTYFLVLLMTLYITRSYWSKFLGRTKATATTFNDNTDIYIS